MSSLGVPDRYMVWVDIFLQPNQIVLVGLAIIVRFVLGLIGSLFGVGGGGSGAGGGGEAGSSSRSTSGDRYRRWGKPLRP